MDIFQLIQAQRDFSVQAFGGKPRLLGVHAHLLKEVEEVKRNPFDISEWADCMLLSIDGALRAGATVEQIAVRIDSAKKLVANTPYECTLDKLDIAVRDIRVSGRIENWVSWTKIINSVVSAARDKGHVFPVLIGATVKKLEENQQREWPDWRTVDENKPIEHIKKDEQFDFGTAITHLKAGRKVARKGWNGKGMFIILVPGSIGVKPVVNTPCSKAGITDKVNIEQHIDMHNAQGSMQPGWNASQADMLAEDWVILP